jgi:hypothetical protein
MLDCIAKIVRRRWASEIDIKDLLCSVSALQTRRTRIGWPDDPTLVAIADLPRLVTCLDKALRAFRDLRGGADYLVSVGKRLFFKIVTGL